MDASEGIRTRTGLPEFTPEMEWELEHNSEPRRSPTDGDVALEQFGYLAADREAPAGMTRKWIFGASADLEARGPASVYGRLCARMAEAETGGAVGNGGYEAMVTAFGNVSRDEFVQAARRATGMPAAEAERLATLCEDVAATALEAMVVRDVRADFARFRDSIDSLLEAPDLRKQFFRMLFWAPAGTGAEVLARLGMDESTRGAVLMNVFMNMPMADLQCTDVREYYTPRGTLRVTETVDCGSDAGLDPADAALVRTLREGRSAVDALDRALDTAAMATSPINLFRDFGPVVNRLLAAWVPDDAAYDDSMLQNGVERRIEDHESDHQVIARFKQAVAFCTGLAVGPLAPVYGAALAAADAIYQGANHERVEWQQRIGVSDHRAQRFLTYGEAAVDGAARTALGNAFPLIGGPGTGTIVLSFAGQGLSELYDAFMRLAREEQ